MTMKIVHNRDMAMAYQATIFQISSLNQEGLNLSRNSRRPVDFNRNRSQMKLVNGRVMASMLWNSMALTTRGSDKVEDRTEGRQEG